MHIAILEPYPEINSAYLTYLADAWHTLIPFWTEHKPSDIDAIIIRSKIRVDKSLLKKYSALSHIFRAWVWVDNIDLESIQQKKIKIINTPGANTHATAELILWWILSLLRNTYMPWKTFDDRFTMMWSELRWKTIWLVWFGHIGEKVYQLIHAVGENTFLIYDPYIDPQAIKEQNIHYVSKKEELFTQSDIISFHIPLSQKTKNFLSKNDFQLLKKTVKIINTSRWGIIDEDGLISFLQNNPAAGAYIDVWEEEPQNPKRWLLRLPNCIITPHIGSMTEEANKLMHVFVF